MPGRYRVPIICFLFLLHSNTGVLFSGGGIEWTQVYDTRGRFIVDIRHYLSDPDSIFSLSRDALLLSTDGGYHWDSIASGNCCGVLAVSPSDSRALFMSETGVPFPGNAILLSNDQGLSWTEIAHGMCLGLPTCAAHIFKESPGDGIPLYASLNPYVLLRTFDHGITWDSIPIPQRFGFWSLELSHQDSLVMYASYSTPPGVFRSVDGGEHWEELPFPYYDEDTAILLALDPRNDDVVYAAVRNHGVFRTVNGGQQWLLMNQGLEAENLVFNVITVNPHNPHEVFLGVADSTWSDGQSSLVFVSVDAGMSWISLSEGLPPSGHVTSFSIDPRTFALFAGVNTAEDSLIASGIYRLGSPTSASSGFPFDAGMPRLYQNHPNPFNGETSIRFALQSRTRVKISLHTLLGEMVAVLLERGMEAGEHEVRFNSGRLSTGVYFYTLETAGFRQTRRLTILR